MNRYQEDYKEFIESLKHIDELVETLTIEQRKSLGARTWTIQGILGRYINEEKGFIKELVDKETPIKPYITLGGRDNIGFHIDGLCGKCGIGVKKRFTCCPNCGQKIDWSEE